MFGYRLLVERFVIRSTVTGTADRPLSVSARAIRGVLDGVRNVFDPLKGPEAVVRVFEIGVSVKDAAALRELAQSIRAYAFEHGDPGEALTECVPRQAVVGVLAPAAAMLDRLAATVGPFAELRREGDTL